MKVIYIILGAAFLLRLASVGFGYPVEVFGDELSNVIVAFKILAAKSPVIPYEAKAFLPPLLSYFLAPLFAVIGVFGIIFGVFKDITDFTNFVILNREWFLAPARVVSAIFGTATVYFIYLLADKIFNKKIALLSAFLLAVDFLHVHDSQIGHIWAPLTFFIVAIMYFSYRLSLSGEKKWYWLSALFIGLGYAVGQVPILFSAAFLLAHLYYVKKTGGRFFNGNFVKSVIVTFVLSLMFTFLNFYTFYKHFYDAAAALFQIFGLNISPPPDSYDINVSKVVRYSFSFNWIFMLKVLFYTSPIVITTAVFGFFVFLKKFKPADLKNIFLVFTPLGYLLFSSLLYYEFNYRYVLPAIPFFIISSAYFIFWLYEKLPFSKAKGAAFVLLVIFVSGYSLVASALYSYKLTRPYTVSQGVRWVYDNVPNGSRIISVIYLSSGKEGVKFGERYNKFNWVDTRKKHLLSLDDQKIPKPNYFLINPNITDIYALPEKEKTADYFMITFYSGEKEREQVKMLGEFEGEKELIAKFYPKENKSYVRNFLNFEPQWVVKSLFGIKNIGPNVEIYKTK